MDKQSTDTPKFDLNQLREATFSGSRSKEHEILREIGKSMGIPNNRIEEILQGKK